MASMLVISIAEEFDAVGEFLVGRMELDDVAAHAEGAALEVDVVAGVLQIDQLAEHLVAVGLHVLADGQHAALVFHRRAEPEDAADRRHQQHIIAADQVAGGGEAQAIQIVIAAGVFLDVDVALRDVRFGLVVVVIADEIADRVVGKEFLEFLVKLGGQRLVVADDQRRAIDSGDGVGHRERFARAGDAHERLKFAASLDAPPPAYRWPGADRPGAEMG